MNKPDKLDHLAMEIAKETGADVDITHDDWTIVVHTTNQAERNISRQLQEEINPDIHVEFAA